MMQMLTLEEWAGERYRSRPPKLGTLQRYARGGLFLPPAQKEGGIWRVREDAELVGNLTSPVTNGSDNPKLLRILNDGCQTT
ncbi:excisionase [Morganella morganii]|uniref:excisionase n=1 Tax=Morganella TaxID=581 RepID=UPI00370BA1C6